MHNFRYYRFVVKLSNISRSDNIGYYASYTNKITILSYRNDINYILRIYLHVLYDHYILEPKIYYSAINSSIVTVKATLDINYKVKAISNNHRIIYLDEI